MHGPKLHHVTSKTFHGYKVDLLNLTQSFLVCTKLISALGPLVPTVSGYGKHKSLWQLFLSLLHHSRQLQLLLPHYCCYYCCYCCCYLDQRSTRALQLRPCYVVQQPSQPLLLYAFAMPALNTVMTVSSQFQLVIQVVRWSSFSRLEGFSPCNPIDMDRLSLGSLH